MTGAVTAMLEQGVDEVLGVDLTGLSSVEVVALLSSLERVRRQLDAVDHRVVAEVESRQLAGDYARSSSVDLLVSTLRVSPAEARARVAQARDLGPRRTLTGEPVSPLMPLTSTAVTEGEISTGHVSVITHCLDRLPPSLPAQAVEVVESTLVTAARHEHPGQLRRTAALLLARVDPDGPEPAEVERLRDLSLGRHGDGLGRLRGRLTPEANAVWDTIIDALSAPVPGEDGLPDERSTGQRRHDALLEAGHRLLRSGTLPAAGGMPVTVLVRTTAADTDTDTAASLRALDPPSGIGQSTRGDVLDLTRLLPVLGDAAVVTVGVDERGAVLHLGRTQRLASTAQRFALAARDGGCCFPGCDRPAAWTEVHHVRPWSLDGPTDIDNLCLLCRLHHREFEPRGWSVRMVGGLPEWIPPAFIDPAQRAVRNRTHHPPDLDFDVGRFTVA